MLLAPYRSMRICSLFAPSLRPKSFAANLQLFMGHHTRVPISHLTFASWRPRATNLSTLGKSEPYADGPGRSATPRFSSRRDHCERCVRIFGIRLRTDRKLGAQTTHTKDDSAPAPRLWCDTQAAKAGNGKHPSHLFRANRGSNCGGHRRFALNPVAWKPVKNLLLPPGGSKHPKSNAV